MNFEISKMDEYIIDTPKIIPEMVTIKEASRRTGLTYSCIHKMALDGKIVHIRVGRRFYINFGKLCEFLNNQYGTVI